MGAPPVYLKCCLFYHFCILTLKLCFNELKLLFGQNMQLSQNPINKNIEKQLYEMLWGVLAELNNPEDIKKVFEDLLTEGERLALIKRIGIALYLDKGRNYEDIKNNIKVSSATIATVAQDLGKPGWQEIVRRIKAEEWAVKWSERIAEKLNRLFVR